MHRSIDCSTWDDPWFTELGPNGKLIFLYLITNHWSKFNAYEIRFDRIGFDTGLDADAVRDALAELAPEVLYIDCGQKVEIYNRWKFMPSDRLPLGIWRKVRSEIFERDNYTCQYCGARATKLECDHVVPLSRGGTNDPSNLTTACKPCNQSKRSKLVGEWRR